MTKNWSTIIQGNLQTPETVDEAVIRLIMVLDGEQKIAIATMQEEDLIALLFSLGMAIRNAFGLHKPDSKLLVSCGVIHPDDASGVIIKALWIRLNK